MRNKTYFLKGVRVKNVLYRFDVDVKTLLPQTQSRTDFHSLHYRHKVMQVGVTFQASAQLWFGIFHHLIGYIISFNTFVQIFLLRVLQRTNRICWKLVSPVEIQSCKHMQATFLMWGSSPHIFSESLVEYSFSYYEVFSGLGLEQLPFVGVLIWKHASSWILFHEVFLVCST